MRDLEKYVGRRYSEVNEEIKSYAEANGLTAFPWPDGIGGAGADPESLIVIINNDIDQIIVRFKHFVEE